MTRKDVGFGHGFKSFAEKTSNCFLSSSLSTKNEHDNGRGRRIVPGGSVRSVRVRV
jgi:hypothetical protein